MADMCIEGSAEQADEEVQDMLEVGMDLLAHCLGQGMSTLAVLPRMKFHDNDMNSAKLETALHQHRTFIC
eukprot:scaffold180104_cov27-Tisochrysis_lutea.AAC.1